MNSDYYEKLIESEEKFRTLFEEIKEPIIVGDENFVHEMCNQAFLDIFGFKNFEELGQTHPGELSPLTQENGEDSFYLAEEKRKEFLEKGFVKFEWLHKKITGEIFPAEVTMLMFKTNRKKYIQTKVVDISERKQYEQKLKEEKEKAENANKSKSEFFAKMSHELRTPLNSIIGFSYLLDEMELNKEKKELINYIKLSSSDLLILINDLLDLSKIESGKVKIRNEVFNFHEMLSELKRMYSNVYINKTLQFDIIYNKATIPEYLYFDSIRLRQILTNLIDNAFTSTYEGFIKIEISKKIQNNKESLEFSIKDSGKGIKKEELPKIFDYDENNLTRKHNGASLGLAIIKGFVNLLNGEITVESVFGKGSNFIVTLPIINSPEIKTEILKTKNKNNIKIAVAEDEEKNQILIKKILEKNGFFVKIAENGAKLLEELNKDNYNLILMDIQMPELNGFEATKIIRNHWNIDIKTIPIIGLSAFVKEDDIKTALELGMNDYITKPFKIDNLIEKIMKYSNKQVIE